MFFMYVFFFSLGHLSETLAGTDTNTGMTNERMNELSPLLKSQSQPQMEPVYFTTITMPPRLSYYIGRNTTRRRRRRGFIRSYLNHLKASTQIEILHFELSISMQPSTSRRREADSPFSFFKFRLLLQHLSSRQSPQRPGQ